MRGEHHKVARVCALSGAAARERAGVTMKTSTPAKPPVLHVNLSDGSRQPVDTGRLARIIDEAGVELDGTCRRGLIRRLFDECLVRGGDEFWDPGWSSLADPFPQ